MKQYKHYAKHINVTRKGKHLMIAVLAILAIVILLFVGPWFSILALNALFGLGIELTFGTWLAMFWVHLIITGTSRAVSEKK